nr:hypothetical protein [Tanacetum cinerariifolium]
QTPGYGISILLAVGTPSTGGGNLYCQWELSPGSGNALCILFPTTKFDECIKRITILSPHEISSWEQSNIKGAFKKDVIPFSKNLKETFIFFEKGFIAEDKEMKEMFKQMKDEVDQYSVAKKSYETEKKQLLINKIDS